MPPLQVAGVAVVTAASAVLALSSCGESFSASDERAGTGGTAAAGGDGGTSGKGAGGGDDTGGSSTGDAGEAGAGSGTGGTMDGQGGGSAGEGPDSGRGGGGDAGTAGRGGTAMGGQAGDGGATSGASGIAGGGAGAGGSGGSDLSGILTFGERTTSRFQGVTRDTEVRSNQATLNFGAMDEMASDTEPDRLALIAFDLSVIPASRSVRSAALKLWTKGEGSGCDSTSGATVPLYPLMEAWDEGTGSASGVVGAASWSLRQPGVPWTIAGLDVGTRSSVPAGAFGPVLLDTEHSIVLAPSVVQSWLTIGANHGLVIWFKPADSNGICFLTSEAADAAKRPELVVTLDG